MGVGDQFEREVEAIFRRANFSVQRNVEIEGFEYDLIVTEEGRGAFEVRIAVECKYRSERQVSNIETMGFLTAFRQAQPTQRFTHGMIVSNTGFSRQAHEAALQQPMVKLFHVDTLEDELLGGRVYLENADRNYRSDGHGDFIDLHATLHPARDWGRSQHIDNVLNFCIEAFRSEAERFVILLGDFGSGKTTIAEQLHKRLGQQYLNGTGEIFPVILYLRTLQNYDTDTAFIESQLRMSARQLDINLIDGMRGRRPVLFILDGFDEVATNALPEERMQLMSRVMKIASRASHLMITSRPSYFTDLDGINALVNELTERDLGDADHFGIDARYGDRKASGLFDRLRRIGRSQQLDRYRGFPADQTSVLYLQPLHREDVIAYMERYSEELHSLYARDVEAVYKILDGIYDITNLLTRPLLLGYLIEVLLAGGIPLDDPNLSFGPAALYLRYINLHLDRDWGARQYLTRNQRLAYARAAAVVMLEAGGSLEASNSSILEVIERGGEIFGPVHGAGLEIERVIADIRICAFMNVSERGRVEFSHKSLMEFFVAEVIVLQLGKQRVIPELRLNLNSEILYFVGSFCLNRDKYFFDLHEQIKLFASKEPPAFKNNVRVALMYAFPVSENQQFRDFGFDRLRLTKKQFIGCDFSRVSLSNLVLHRVAFDRCTFAEMMIGGEIDGTTFQDCRGQLGVTGTLHNVDVISCTPFKFHGRGASDRSELRARILSFDRGRWRDSHISVDAQTVSLSGVTLERCTVEAAVDTVLRFENATLSQVSAEFSAPVRMKFAGCSLKGVRFRKAVLDVESIRAHREMLPSCAGVLFVDDPDRRCAILFRDLGKGPEYVGWVLIGALLILKDDFISFYEASADKIRKYLEAADASQKISDWAVNLHLPRLDPPRGR